MIIFLRRFTQDDIARLIGWVNAAGPEAFVHWAGTKFDFPLDEAQLAAHLAEAEGPNPRRYLFAAVDEASGAVVGHVELTLLDQAQPRALIDRLLVGEPSMRHQGLGVEIVSRVLEEAFGEMGLQRVEASVLDLNVAAVRTYESLGFEMEGHFIEARRVGGKYWNVYEMSMTKERWLAPDSR